MAAISVAVASVLGVRAVVKAGPAEATRTVAFSATRISATAATPPPPVAASAASAAAAGRGGLSPSLGLPPAVGGSLEGGQPSAAATAVRLPPTVNWHLEERCNYACTFCFATFQDNAHLPVESDLHNLLSVPAALAAHGVTKLNFAGGEPFLHPHIEPLLEASKEAGLVTSVVTNGSLLQPSRLEHLRSLLDVIAFSVDASSDDIHARIGRGLRAHVAGGRSRHLADVLLSWHKAKELGYFLKLNTVVCRENLDDDMAELVRELQPNRWKVFQVLPVEGQNDGRVEGLLISKEEFDAWVGRHKAKVAEFGVELVPEDNSQMTATYALLDARGRFFSNKLGYHKYGLSVMEVGVPAAWESLDYLFDPQGFILRGGLYDCGQSEAARAREQEWLEMGQL